MLDSLGRCADSSAISKGDPLALLTLYAFLFINLTHSRLRWRLDPLKVKQYTAKIPYSSLSASSSFLFSELQSSFGRNKMWGRSWIVPSGGVHVISWLWLYCEIDATSLMTQHSSFYKYTFQIQFNLWAWKKSRVFFQGACWHWHTAQSLCVHSYQPCYLLKC